MINKIKNLFEVVLKIKKVNEKLINLLFKLRQINIKDDIEKVNKCDVLLICHDFDRSLNFKGLAYSPLLDSLRDELEWRGLKCISILHPWSKLNKINGYGNPVAINRSYLIYLIFENIFFIKIFKKNIYKDPYRKVVEASNPKLIITIGCPVELAQIASLKNIYLVELLHGIGYSTIPWGWVKRLKNELPCCIMTMDEVSSATFAPLASKEVCIKMIPHPFFRRFIGKQINLIPGEWRCKKRNFSKQILLSLSTLYAGDHGERSEFSNILKNGLFYQEIEELISEDSGVFWRIRLHPVQMRSKRFVRLKNYLVDFCTRNKNCEWVESSSIPYPSVAFECEGNISMHTMSCYDAAAVGLQTLMLCPTVLRGGVHENDFLDLEKVGYVVKESINKQKIKDWIFSVKKITPKLPNVLGEKAWEDSMNWLIETAGLDGSL